LLEPIDEGWDRCRLGAIGFLTPVPGLPQGSLSLGVAGD
jgi:hypothetical protein